MSDTQQREAGAVTPTLFLGPSLSRPHVYVHKNAETAVKAIKAGHTVRTESEEMCVIALMNLGVAYTEAKDRVFRAKFGTVEDIEESWDA